MLGLGDESMGTVPPCTATADGPTVPSLRAASCVDYYCIAVCDACYGIKYRW